MTSLQHARTDLLQYYPVCTAFSQGYGGGFAGASARPRGRGCGSDDEAPVGAAADDHCLCGTRNAPGRTRGASEAGADKSTQQISRRPLIQTRADILNLCVYARARVRACPCVLIRSRVDD